MSPCIFDIPGHLPSAANLREHWAVKAKRVKAQRNKARLKCPRWQGHPVVHVVFCRFAPKPLDTDNLASALKAYRDGIASRLGFDDGSPLVSWEYKQETCEAGKEFVRVSIWRVP